MPATDLYVIVDAAGSVLHGPAAWSAFDFGRRMQELLDAHNAALPPEPPPPEPWTPPPPPDPLPDDWTPPEPPEPEPWTPSTRVGSVALGSAAPAAALAWDGVPFRVLPCAVPADFDRETQVLGVPVVDGDAASVAPVDKPLAEVQALRVGQIKAEAGRRIIERFPMWKQSNMNMRANHLNDIRLDGGAWTAEEAAEAAELRASGAWIRAVREASDQIEAWVRAEGRSVSDLRTMAGAPAWPE